MTKRKATKKFEAQRRTLWDKREQLVRKLADSRREENAAELDRGDDLDRAAASRDREINYMLSSREREELRAIEEALEKIEDGLYGTCERCEKSIGAKRLKALPLAPYCRDCQTEMERAQRRNRALGL
ncbi:MAG: TraR/DksA family transcriptional regulator [Nitrospinota bacterium]